MIIKTLVENTKSSEGYDCEHGLSLHIETKNHKLLFDLGASGLFVENALKMGVDLSEVDLVVISHGHHDHGGGLGAFLDLNSKAKIYLSEKAFRKHYANRPGGEKAYVGLDRRLLNNERFTYVGEHLVIDDELELFSNIKGTRFNPSGNKELFMKIDTSLLQDDFAHEQSLIVKEAGKTLLVAGCAHKGIVNIIDYIGTSGGLLPSHVIGGFHLYNRSENSNEDPVIVSRIGEYLKSTGSKYYTCHCTGIESYNKLKEIMEDKIQYLATGSKITI